MKKLMEIMPDLRNVGMSNQAREFFNSRVVDGNKVKLPNIATTKFATYFNKSRCQYNATVFCEYFERHHSKDENDNIPKTAIVIKSKPSWTKTGKALSFGQRKTIFEKCSDADVTTYGSKHCDPLLTLFSGCQMMGTQNDDVANGIANGTTSKFKKVAFKTGKEPHRMKLHGYWVWAIDAQDVEHVINEWDNSRQKGCFKMEPKQGAYSIYFPFVEEGQTIKVKTGISLLQIPLLLNHATTGHKLQGKSLEELIIAEWSKRSNWAYVVLSRVRTLAGLYLLSKIPDDIDFTPSPYYLRMMENIRVTKNLLRTKADVADLHEQFTFPS